MALRAVEYLVPSLKTWPTSIPLAKAPACRSGGRRRFRDGTQIRIGECRNVTLEVHVQDVRVGLVRARDPVRVGHEFMVGDDGAGGEAHGTREAHRGVGPLGHLLGRGEDHSSALK